MPASEVFKKYASGQLHSGSKSGPVVKSHAQAVAIYMSEKASPKKEYQPKMSDMVKRTKRAK